MKRTTPPSPRVFVDRDAPAPLIRTLLDAAGRVAHDIEVRVDGALLTGAQARIAAHLAASETGKPSAELACRADMTAPAVSQMLDRMERRGVIARTPHPLSRQCHLITLTERGRAQYEDVAWRLAALEQSYRIALGRGGADRLSQALDALARQLY